MNADKYKHTDIERLGMTEARNRQGHWASKFEAGVEATEEDGVVYGIEGCAEV